MIVLGIVGIWFVLTAVGYVALSSLSRAGEREERKASLELYELRPATLAMNRPPIPKAMLG